MIELIELHALADGELSADREQSVRVLLNEDSASRMEFEAIVAVKAILRDRVEPTKCDAEWKACAVRLRELQRVRRTERIVSSGFAWGLSCFFFGAIIVAGLMHRGNESTNTSSSEVTRMISGLQAARDTGPTATPNTKLAVDELFKISQISIDPQRMDVLGRAYSELDGRPVTIFKLRDASGDLMLIVVPNVLEIEGMGVMRRDHSFRLGHVEKWNSVAWTDGTRTLLLVADRPYEDLATAASGLENSLRRP